MNLTKDEYKAIKAKYEQALAEKDAVYAKEGATHLELSEASIDFGGKCSGYLAYIFAHELHEYPSKVEKE